MRTRPRPNPCSPLRLQVQHLHAGGAQLVVRHEIDAGQQADLHHARPQAAVQAGDAVLPADRRRRLPHVRVAAPVVLRDQPRPDDVQRRDDERAEGAGGAAAHEIRHVAVAGVQVVPLGQRLEALVRPELGDAVGDAERLRGRVALPEGARALVGADRADGLGGQSGRIG